MTKAAASFSVAQALFSLTGPGVVCCSQLHDSDPGPGCCCCFCYSRGILLKGASVIDSLAGCRVVALDKTGTLTTGELTCTAVVPHLHSFDEPDSFDEADGPIDYDQPACAEDMMEGLAAALALSRGSVHPVSNAVSEAFGEEQPLTPLSHPYLSLPQRHNLPAAAI